MAAPKDTPDIATIGDGPPAYDRHDPVYRAWAWKRLREPFPAEWIGQKPIGGGHIDYVGHAAVVTRLLEVDPEWTIEPAVTDAEGFPVFSANGGMWARLTVLGVTRLEYGQVKGGGTKAVLSDVLKRCAMRFGVALDLWAKEDLQGDTVDEPHPPSQVEEAVAFADQAVARQNARTRRPPADEHDTQGLDQGEPTPEREPVPIADEEAIALGYMDSNAMRDAVDAFTARAKGELSTEERAALKSWRAENGIPWPPRAEQLPALFAELEALGGPF